MKLDHVSPSALEAWNICGQRFYYARVEKIIMPPGVAMIRGTGVHEGRKTNLRYKFEAGTDLPMDVVQDAARDSVVTQFAGDVQLAPEDGTISEARAKTVDTAVRLVNCDYDAFQKGIVPAYVEQGWRASIPGYETDLLGYVDVMDVDWRIHDLKTKTRRPSANTADVSLPLTAYDLLAKANGHAVRDLCLEFVIATAKGKTSAVVLRTTRTAAHHKALLARLEQLIVALDKEVFLPCGSDSWVCGPKYCGYTELCPYFHGHGRPKT